MSKEELISLSKNRWYHITTVEQAHAILTQGLIAPPEADEHDPAHHRTRTWGHDHHLRSRNGYVYLAHEDTKPIREVMRVINEQRKTGTNDLIALRVDLSNIAAARLAADEDVLEDIQNYLPYWQDFTKWLNQTKGAKISLEFQKTDDYEAAAYDFIENMINDGTISEYEDIWNEYRMYDEFSEEMIHTQQNIFSSALDGSIADKVDRELDAHEDKFVEMSIKHGLLAIEGNIHPDDITIHPDYEIKYKLWTRGQDPDEIAPLPYAHIDPNQLQFPQNDF